MQERNHQPMTTTEPSDADIEAAGDMTAPVNVAAPSKDQKHC